VTAQFDLQSICLPKQLQWVTDVMDLPRVT